MLGIFKKEVFVIGDHEVVKKVHTYEVCRDVYYRCRRCNKQLSDRDTFHEKDCHTCNCGYCDR